MSVVDNLFNDNVPITITGGVELTANLIANPWNRTTIADGYWLQTRTVDPFSARDIYLANCIDDVSAKVNDIEYNISVGTINSLISMNNVIYSPNNYWEGLPATIAPSVTSKAAPSNTLTYMTLGEDSDVGNYIDLNNDRTCIIQGNFTENSFNQILLTKGGMFYRSVSGDDIESVPGEKVDNYDVLDIDKGFAQILDDSTINSPGYWFLQKESNGRPVWTNINAFDTYIDNRVNPDNVYIGWSADDTERKLILIPPNTGNTTTAIDPTDDSYTNNAYAWSEYGWVPLEPLMTRTDIETEINKGAVLKDFLSLFSANGVMDHKSNFGHTMRSECSDDGYYYTTLFGETYRTILMNSGAPRNVIGDTYDLSAVNDPNISRCVYYQKVSDLSVTASANQTLRALLTESGTNTYLSKPVFIELAPFKYTNDGVSLPRTWDLHFCIKGLGTFKKSDVLNITAHEILTNPATIDVSIVVCTGAPTSATVNYITSESKTYYVTEGECLMTEASFGNNPLGQPLTNNYVPAVNVAKSINYHQAFSAGQVETGCTPYLRVCIDGISACTSAPVGLTDIPYGRFALGVEISGQQNSGYSGTPFSNFGSERFVEEFTDDRFMSAAYNYVTAES